MICEPPGEPTVATSWPLSRSNTSVGAIDERGRLPGCTRLATGLPFSLGTKEKSVSWLLSMKPRTIRCEPKYDSIVVVIEMAPPRSSTATICEVEMRGGERSGA
ncbi:hypothetical protein CUTA107171_28220 [Cupriavidus taiwanensis]